MRQPLRFYFFHVYIAQESRFGCPESLHTTSWIVRLDSVDKIPPQWVCPKCIRALGLNIYKSEAAETAITAPAAPPSAFMLRDRSCSPFQQRMLRARQKETAIRD
jgi:hypothetical protein